VTSAEAHADLSNSRLALLGPLAGLSEEQFRYLPPEGGWPIAAHLAHFLRVERAVCEGIANARSTADAQMTSAGASNDGDDALAQHLAVPQIIHGLQASHRALDALLDDRAILERELHHARMGRITVGDLLRAHADHEREHAEQIVALVKQARTARRLIIPLAQQTPGRAS
jgi:uncharacterized damage-inducible protein DinB